MVLPRATVGRSQREFNSTPAGVRAYPARMIRRDYLKFSALAGIATALAGRNRAVIRARKVLAEDQARVLRVHQVHSVAAIPRAGTLDPNRWLHRDRGNDPQRRDYRTRGCSREAATSRTRRSKKPDAASL